MTGDLKLSSEEFRDVLAGKVDPGLAERVADFLDSHPEDSFWDLLVAPDVVEERRPSGSAPAGWWPADLVLGRTDSFAVGSRVRVTFDPKKRKGETVWGIIVHVSKDDTRTQVTFREEGVERLETALSNYDQISSPVLSPEEFREVLAGTAERDVADRVINFFDEHPEAHFSDLL